MPARSAARRGRNNDDALANTVCGRRSAARKRPYTGSQGNTPVVALRSVKLARVAGR